MKHIFFFSILLFFGSVFQVFAADLSGYAWSSNIGWIKFAGPGYGTNFDADTGDLFGYAWSPNIGWISFDGAEGEILSWGGRLKLHGATYGITTEPDQCYLRGWAWGEEPVGWVRFSGDNYGVHYAECAVDNEDTPVQCDFTASPAQVAKAGRTTLRWDCQNTATSCSIAGVGANLAQAGTARTNPLSQTTEFSLTCRNGEQTGTVTTSVRVLRPNYCEIIPFLGTCR